MFILWYSASSTFGKDSDIVMGVRAQQKEKTRRLGRACQKVPEPRDPLRIRAHAHLPCFTAYRVHVAEGKRCGLP
jgi:hypothetical protein